MHAMLCESLMFPSCWARTPGFRMGPVDADTARMHMPLKPGSRSPRSGSTRKRGSRRTFETMRFKGKDGPKVRWRITMLGWRRFGAIRIPERMMVRWADERGPWLEMRLERS